MSISEVTTPDPLPACHRERPATRTRPGGRPRHAVGMVARQRIHRLQGGLRGGRMRCLRRAGGPTRGDGRPAGPPSTPASSPPPGWTTRRSSPPKGSASRAGCTPCSRRWPAAADRNAATAHRVSSARWPRSSTAATAGRRRVNGSRRPNRTPSPQRSIGRRGSNGRAAGSNGSDPTAPGNAPDHEHGPNGFDLHALSGNLCRCTGYRPIRDAAYALGEPDAADPLLARLDRPAPAPAATDVTSSQGRFRPAGRSRRDPRPARRQSRCAAGGRVDRLGRRAEHPALAGGPDPGHRSAAGAAHARHRRRLRRHRRRTDPVGDRTGTGRPDPVAGAAVPAVRVPADPERRHPGRQSGDRFADRGQPARACWRSTPRLVLASRERRAGGAVVRVLHRIPADAANVRTN